MKRERKKERDVSASTPSSVCQRHHQQTDDGVDAETSLSFFLSLFMSISLLRLFSRAHYWVNEKRFAGTCWVSGVKFNHGSTSSRWRRLLAVETLAIDRWHDRTIGEDLRARSIAIEVKHFRHPAAANRTCC